VIDAFRPRRASKFYDLIVAIDTGAEDLTRDEKE